MSSLCCSQLVCVYLTHGISPLHLNTETKHSCWSGWHTRSKDPQAGTLVYLRIWPCTQSTLRLQYGYSETGFYKKFRRSPGYVIRLSDHNIYSSHGCSSNLWSDFFQSFSFDLRNVFRDSENHKKITISEKLTTVFGLAKNTI